MPALFVYITTTNSNWHKAKPVSAICKRIQLPCVRVVSLRRPLMTERSLARPAMFNGKSVLKTPSCMHTSMPAKAWREKWAEKQHKNIYICFSFWAATLSLGPHTTTICLQCDVDGGNCGWGCCVLVRLRLSQYRVNVLCELYTRLYAFPFLAVAREIYVSIG